MQTKKSLLFCAAIIGSSTLLAQDWKIGGNALTAPGKFGSTNAQDVQFITNNVVNGVFTKTGSWGFGTTLPSAKLHVNSAANENPFRVQVAGSTKLIVRNDGGLSVGSLGAAPASGLFVTGSAGIGVNNPAAKLHVRVGSSGATPFAGAAIIAENSTHSYISLLSPSTAESGIIFGNNTNAVSGGIFYNNPFSPGAQNGLQFRTNGNITRMVLTDEGMLNVGPGSNDDYRLFVNHSGELGLDIANSGLGTDWELFAGSGGLNLFVDGGAGGPKGLFNRSNGVYSALSDERAKTNIRPMASVLERLGQLKPASYQFKTAKDQREEDGFIAQEVMKVFPGLVTHNVDAERKTDVYMLNYSGFGVIAIKAIQELMKVSDTKDVKLELQQKQIDGLQKQIDELKALTLRAATTSAATNKSSKSEMAHATAASLEQNTPNPFGASTIIGYTLPQNAARAQVVITDKNGAALKRIAVPGAGRGTVTVDASSLLPGAYNYSLIVNGNVVGSKQMIVLK